MAAPRKYPDELASVRSARSAPPAARSPRSRRIKEALRGWVRQAEADRGDRLTTAEQDELRQLRKEVAKLSIPSNCGDLLTSWCVIAGDVFLLVGGMIRMWRSCSVGRFSRIRCSQGSPGGHLVSLVEELADPWQAVVEGRRHEARGGARKREAGAGARHRLVFVDRLVATLIHLRHDLPHAALGLLFGVDRSTITRATAEIRGLLAERGRAVPDRPGLRLRTLADVFAFARAEGIELRLDATGVQVRRPPAGRGGRRAFVPGKKKQNTMKATVVADHQGRTLWTDALRPGRMHDATAARNEGVGTCFQHFPDVEVLLDDGYLGLRRDHPGQAVTPPRKGNKISPPEVLEARLRARHRHSSKRITVEHALADHERWKQLARWTHRRENLPATYRAIAGPVSDRNTTH